jgi:YVTN family beta-propeller protein
MKTVLMTLSSIVAVAALSMMTTGQPGDHAAVRAETRDGDTKNAVSTRRPARNVVGHPTFVSPHANPIAVHADRVFVVNTPADTVDVIDAGTRKVVHRVSVGVDPVSIAVRPDGREVWVSNHVSDSVSVIDNDQDSPTYLNVIATVQEFGSKRATTFDEPVGIAFAGNDKAYVALSSENQVAVVDVASRKVTRQLTISAQDPRAIAVRDGKLYVIPFESNNKTQLSGGRKDDIDGDLVTFDAWEHSIVHNNVLSLGHVVDIIRHPEVPDRDLFVFDTKTDELVETVNTLGTLLYGLTVASDGTVFVAQTDARNDVNGRAGTKKHDLSQLENRAFLNQITRIDFGDKGQANQPRFIDLEPLPPQHPEPGQELATPFAIQISDDDATLVVSAAASDRVFTVDAASGEVLGRVDVDAVPRGIALQHYDGGLSSAWVLNTVANTVSFVDLTDREAPQVVSTITLDDPTHPAVKRGRMAFETAAASSTGTFSCASCHPDGHTDQLLWVLKTPVVTGGDQIMPRSTMPVRGLRDTEPYHWDGIPGDPYGGNNSANVHGSDPPNSDAGNPLSSARHLIDGGLASTMALFDEDHKNDEGKVGRLSAAERDDMATFLLCVPYPPAQRRPYTSEVTERARKGFELFHILGDNDPSKPKANVCGDCHRMPHLVSTNTPGTGMDTPTWRGAYDRFLILPQGRLNIVEFPFYRRVAERGQSEEEIWRFSWGGRERFNPVWNMVLEMSTGYSGAFARQVTLSKDSVGDEITLDLLDALENAALDAAVVLEGDGVRIAGDSSAAVQLQFGEGGRYYDEFREAPHTREELVREVVAGRLVVTFTAHLGENCDVDHPQPAIWTVGPIEKQRGAQQFPVLYPDQLEMLVSGRHVDKQARIFLNGHRVDGTVALEQNERVAIRLEELPEVGMHLLQLQNPNGQFSNDFIVTVAQAKPVHEQDDDLENPKTLAEALKRSGWEDLVGDWVDEGLNGKGLKLSFRWKIEDRILEAKSIDPERTSVSLISVNAANGDIFQAGADSTGGSHLGTWQFKKDDEAVLNLGYTDGNGTPGQITLRYKLIDDHTLDFTVGLPQPIRIRLIRATD